MAKYLKTEDGYKSFEELDIGSDRKTKELIEDVSVQADMNELNPESLGYIKNKTHWMDTLEEYVVFDGSMERGEQITIPLDYFIPDRTVVQWYFNDGAHTRTSVINFSDVIQLDNVQFVKNGVVSGWDIYIHNELHTLILKRHDFYSNYSRLKLTFKNIPAAKRLNEEFIPYTIARDSVKMDKINPEVINSISMGRNADIAMGSNSVAFGRDVVANHAHNFVVGKFNKYKNSAYEIQEVTKAYTQWDVSVEVSTSFTFDDQTGELSLDNPQQYLPTDGKPPIGSYLKDRSNSFFRVEEKSSYQISEGYIRYLDVTWIQPVEIKFHDGEHVFTVGNGTSDTERSNAHTLDWNGLGWFKGGLKIGGTSQDDANAKEVALKEDIAQADWSQNDETAIDYVKGRTHYKYENPNKVLIDGVYPVEIYNNKYPRIVIDNFRIEPNVSYTVTLNGVSETSSSITMVHIQSQNVSGQIYGDGGISHHRVYTHYLDGVNSLWIYNDSVLTGLSECHVKIEDNTEYVYQPLTEEYLPIKTFRDGEGYCSSVIGDDKAKATGSFSCAIGTGTVAKGLYSFAEGAYTEAANPAAHAEGYYTIAAGYQQHVQGKYNVEDKDSKYAHIVGNGNTGTKRSNAHTLDWDGLGWFKGGLKVGGTSQDDAEAKEVVTKDDKLPNPNALTFSGAVTGTYDGSAPLTVEIPEAVTDEHINNLINTALGVIENGTY